MSVPTVQGLPVSKQPMLARFQKFRSQGMDVCPSDKGTPGRGPGSGRTARAPWEKRKNFALCRSARPENDFADPVETISEDSRYRKDRVVKRSEKSSARLNSSLC